MQPAASPRRLRETHTASLALLILGDDLELTLWGEADIGGIRPLNEVAAGRGGEHTDVGNHGARRNVEDALGAGDQAVGGSAPHGLLPVVGERAARYIVSAGISGSSGVQRNPRAKGVEVSCLEVLGVSIVRQCLFLTHHGADVPAVL